LGEGLDDAEASLTLPPPFCMAVDFVFDCCCFSAKKTNHSALPDQQTAMHKIQHIHVKKNL